MLVPSDLRNDHLTFTFIISLVILKGESGKRCALEY